MSNFHFRLRIDNSYYVNTIVMLIFSFRVMSICYMRFILLSCFDLRMLESSSGSLSAENRFC